MLRHRWEDAVDARENFVTDNRNWSGTDEDHQNWSGTDEDNHKWSGPDGSDSDYEPAYEEEPEEETEGSRGRQLLLEKSISCEEGQTHIDLRTVMAGLVNAVYKYEETRRLLKRSTGRRKRDKVKRVAHKLSAFKTKLVLGDEASSASADLEEVAAIWKEAGFKVKSETCLQNPKGTTSFWSCSSWTPHLYLNEGDPISKGYLNFFGDQQFILDSMNSRSSHPSFRTWWAEVCREVQPQTILSLLRRKLQIPNHLFPSAIIMYSPGPQQTSRSIIKRVMRSHTVEQWLKTNPLPCHVILGGATS